MGSEPFDPISLFKLMFSLDRIEQFLASAGLIILAIVLLFQQAGIPIPIPTMLIVIAAGLDAALGFHPLPVGYATMLAALCVGLGIQYVVARRGGTAASERVGRYI